MGVIVLGDVGVRAPYHVGDEAMTEYALVALRDRGVDDITIIGGDVETTEKRFGTKAVPRIGFDGTQPPAWRKNRLASVLASLSGDDSALAADDSARAVIKAVRGASGVLIAGGGNIASEFTNHFHERIALAAIARHFNVPLVLSSQTFGPAFYEGHARSVGEMFDCAALIGTRERTSYDLALQLGAAAGKTVHGVDDAFWLRPTEQDYQRVKDLGLPSEYMLASFTSHPGKTGWGKEAYYRRIADTLEALVQEFSMPVLLISHVGSLSPESRTHDQLSNDIIAGMCASGQVRHLPMMISGEVIAVTEGATVNLSTRYHPAIFGTGAGVPSIGISLSRYSSVKLGGALGNVGLQDFVIPAASWRPELITEVAGHLIANKETLAAHSEKVTGLHRAQSTQWWDAIASTVTGNGTPSGLPSIQDVEPLAGTPRWRDEIVTVAAVADAAEQKATAAKWELEAANAKAARLEKALENTRTKTDRLEKSLAASRAERDALKAKIKALQSKVKGLQPKPSTTAQTPKPLAVRGLRRAKRVLKSLTK